MNPYLNPELSDADLEEITGECFEPLTDNSTTPEQEAELERLIAGDLELFREALCPIPDEEDF